MGFCVCVVFPFSPSLPSLSPTHPHSSWTIRYFVARANKLTGPLPSSLATSANLMTLDVRNNSLSSLPKEWVSGWPGAATSSLVNVRVSFNALEGAFPSALGACPGLTFLTVNNNSLSGALPATDGAFPALRALNASFNAFTGPIPDAFLTTGLFTLPPLNLGLGGVGLVHVFDVSRNALTGPVPSRLLGAPPPPPHPGGRVCERQPGPGGGVSCRVGGWRRHARSDPSRRVWRRAHAPRAGARHGRGGRRPRGPGAARAHRGRRRRCGRRAGAAC